MARYYPVTRTIRVLVADNGEVTENINRQDVLTQGRRAANEAAVVHSVEIFNRKSTTSVELLESVISQGRRAETETLAEDEFNVVSDGKRAADEVATLEEVATDNRRASSEETTLDEVLSLNRKSLTLRTTESEFNVVSDSRRAANDATLLEVVTADSRRADTVTYAKSDIVNYASDATADQGWTTVEGAEGNNTNTQAQLQAVSSGLGGLTSNTTTGTLTLAFTEEENPSQEVSTDTVIEVERTLIFSGPPALNQAANVRTEYTLNGTDWVIIETATAAQAKGFISSAPLALSKAQIAAIGVRVVGSVTSGTLVGATVTAQVHRVRKSHCEEQTVPDDNPQPEISFTADSTVLTADSTQYTADRT